MGTLGNNIELYYLAVIGDLRKSRALQDRSSVQLHLEETLRDLNRVLGRSSLAARFVVTLGDEFQGLLKLPAAGLDALLFVEAALRDVTLKFPLRFGLGWGRVSTEFRRQALGMDGPCFHNAREALQEGKREDRWATVCGFGEDGDRVLNGLFALLGAVRDGWTNRQRETVAVVREARTQKDAAELMGVRPSTVSQALTAALYSPVCDAEAALATALSVFGKIAESGDASVKEPNF